jgi:alkylation response protein AidB-like acyl-CoA dehydrogenase
MQPKTTAKRDGSAYVLNGEKTLVVGAASAELFLISAQLDGGKPSLFVVEAGVVGLSVSPQPAMGLRAAALARVHLQNIRLPLSARMDDKLDFAEFLAASRLAWCALAVGAGQAALDYVIPYCNDRKAFGEPISHRQAVAFMVANIGIEVEGMRLATRRAAARAAAGKSFVREAALARSLCGRHGMKIGSDAVQLLGGHGFTHEYPVERFYRDLRAMAVLEGAILV